LNFEHMCTTFEPHFLVMSIIIRKAGKDDLANVLDLIKELALFEKAVQEVSLTVEEMEKDGFEKNLFSILLAVKDESVLGMALYFPVYSTWKGRCLYLEDLIVHKNSRRLGVGKKLMKALVQEAKEFGAHRLSWQVLDWNEPAIDFYKGFDSSMDGEWINCKLVKDQFNGIMEDKKVGDEGI